MNPLSKGISDLSCQIGKIFKTGIYNYCDIETAVDEFTVLYKDGSLGTTYQVLGTASIVGEHEHARIVNEINHIKGNLEDAGFSIQVCFSKSNHKAEAEVDRMLKGMQLTQKRHGLKLNAIFEEKRSVLKEIVNSETCTLCLKTSPKCLDKQIHTADKKQMFKFVSNNNLNTGSMGQGIKSFCQSVIKQHESFCELVEKALKGNIDLRKYTAKEALTQLKEEIDTADFDGFAPIVIGDKLPISLTPELTFDDTTHTNYPAIAYQLFNWPVNLASESGVGDPNIIHYGTQYIAPLIVDIPPQEIRSFSRLFASIQQDVPYRISFRIKSGHDAIKGMINFKRMISTALLLTSQVNTEIKEGADTILEELNKEGSVLVKLNIAICTWGNTIKEAQTNRLALKRALVSWGKAGVAIEKGDIVDAWVETLPSFFTKTCVSSSFPLSFNRTISILPMFRQADAFSNGQRAFQSTDGKIVFMENFSSKQTCWIELIDGRAGLGKSVFLNDSLASQVYFAGNENLPYQAVLDVNPSSQYYIEHIQNILPESKKHLASYIIVENSQNYAINVFDTKLGCRSPIDIDKSFLRSFLTLLLTPPESKETTKNLPNFVSKLVDSVYEYYSDKRPKEYSKNVDRRVDEAIEKASLTLHYDPTWWEVVDALFDAGYTDEAILAQRHAVPTLNDLSEVITNDSSLKNQYENAQVDQEKFIDVVYRNLQAVIRDYPALSVPSKISVDRARMISVNLKKVDGDTEEDKKRAAIFYMCYMHLLSSRFFTDHGVLSYIPEKYKTYHEAIISDIKSTSKTVAFDEFHKANKHKIVRSFADTLVREGRKFKVGMKFASQFSTDYTEFMRKSATAIFVFDSQSQLDEKETMQRTFGYNNDVRFLLDREVKGPSSKGAVFLMRLDISGKAPIWQVCYNKLGPRELWSYVSGQESVLVRQQLAKQVGYEQALSALASRYPKGNIQSEYEALKNSHEELLQTNLIQVFVDKVLETIKYRSS